MRKKVGDALLQLGITPSVGGFNYIIDMVEEINTNGIEKVVASYEIIGKRYKKNGQSVERAIRHAVSKIDTTTDDFQKYTGMKPHVHMTNSDFLYALAYKMKEEV